jgi:hypothetical protein
MNIQGLLIAVLLWVASIAGSFFYGQSVGTDQEKVKQTEIKQAIEDTREVARQGAASEIAKIKVRNTTIQGKVTTLVRDNPVYRDCVNDPAGLQLINEALTGKSSGTGRYSGDGLPTTVSPLR